MEFYKVSARFTYKHKPVPGAAEFRGANFELFITFLHVTTCYDLKKNFLLPTYVFIIDFLKLKFNTLQRFWYFDWVEDIIGIKY